MTFLCNNIQNIQIYMHIFVRKNGDDDNDMHVGSAYRSIDNIGNDVYVFC